MKAAAMVNAHSHAFQIELRGIAERAAGPHDDFWSWRTEMYRLALRHDPQSMRAVGERAYGEMVRAGYGAVGEFHYVHHRPDGARYEPSGAMAIALAQAAQARGLEIVLLPAAYNRAGPGLAATDEQRRFCDPDLGTFLARVDELRVWADGRTGVSVGVAVHSVRAVPADWIEAVGRYAASNNLVAHVHASEQRREVEECLREHGCTPIELLSRCGFLGPRTSLIHAIHVTDRDIELIAASDAIVVACPTTEGSLGDGYQPALRYAAAGVRYAIGSDSQVRIDPFEEARELETGARREGQTRSALLAADGDLWQTLAGNGRASLGLEGPLRELELDLDSPELAGIPAQDIPRALVTCASAAVVSSSSSDV